MNGTRTLSMAAARKDTRTIRRSARRKRRSSQHRHPVPSPKRPWPIRVCGTCDASPARPILPATQKCREETMRHALTAAIAMAFAVALPPSTPAQTPSAALTGLVSSAEEPAMEGVLVSATKAGSNITVSVVTGADGRYSFPTSRLAPGQYALAVRAVGYELDQPSKIDIGAGDAAKSATADLGLRKTADLAAQLSNGEWLASIPGTDQQKGQLLNCVGCHTVQR